MPKMILVNTKDTIFDNGEMEKGLLLHSNFTKSSFKNTNFSKCIIEDVAFENCDLRGANMSCEGMEKCSFYGSIYDEKTIWKEGFEPINHGCKKVMDYE